jgi:hypothetical protein
VGHKFNGWLFLRDRKVIEMQGEGPEKRSKDWSYAILSQGKPRTEGHHWKLEEAGKDSHLESSREHGPVDTLIFDVWPLGERERTGEERKGEGRKGEGREGRGEV